MRSILPILPLLATAGMLHAQLEDRSEVLLEKLAQFESSERFKTEVSIEQKRKEVAVAIEQKREEVAKTLSSYRDQALVAKNLEKANEIDAKTTPCDLAVAGKEIHQ